MKFPRLRVKHLLIATFLVALSAAILVYLNRSVRFDSVRWQTEHLNGKHTESSSDESNLRYLMVDDLIRNHLREGITPRSKVKELLGDPDHSEAGKKWQISAVAYDAYLIRFYLNIIDYDSVYLIIEYDISGRIKNVRKLTIQG